MVLAWSWALWLAWLSAGALTVAQTLSSVEHQVASMFGSRNATGGLGTTHTNNWAVLVCSSRYWFNYRVSQPSLGGVESFISESISGTPDISLPSFPLSLLYRNAKS